MKKPNVDAGQRLDNLMGARDRVRWRRAVSGTLGFLKSLPFTSCIHGEKWRQGMRLYYSKRIVDLLEHPPVGCEAEAERFRVAYGLQKPRRKARR